MNNQAKLLIAGAPCRKRGKRFLTWLVIFLFLDVCTTIFGLSTGLHEMNPVVWSMMRFAGLHGLLISKVLALALATYFLYSGRLLLLQRVTALMGLVVAWNLLWILAR